MNLDLLTFKRRDRFLTIRDVWYNRDTLYTDADAGYYMQTDKPVGNDYYDQFTIINDLTLPEDKLFNAINATGRNEIRLVQNKLGFQFHVEHEDLKKATLNKFI